MDDEFRVKLVILLLNLQINYTMIEYQVGRVNENLFRDSYSTAD